MPAASLKRIGILGGSSDQATAEYYRLINKGVNERLGGWNTGDTMALHVDAAVRWALRPA